jgi:hypothetical protein
MGTWGTHPFENDDALDEVYTLINHLLEKVETLACKPHRRGDSVLLDAERLAANVELLLLIARRVYRTATFTWMIRGDLLADADTVDGWKAKFLERWDQHARRQLEGSATELHKLGRTLARPMDRLAVLSRRQQERLQSTYQEYLEKIVAARRREQSEGGK